MKLNQIELNKILAEHEEWLKGHGGARANLPNADLSGLEIKDRDLEFANLEHTNLSNAVIENVNMAYVKMEGANLRNAKLNNISITLKYGYDEIDKFSERMEQEEVEKQLINLLNDDLFLDFNSCILDSAVIKDCDFSGSDFTYASFDNGKIYNTTFEDVAIDDTTFINSELQNCRFANIKMNNIDLTDSILSNVDFSNIEFEEIDFQDCIMNSVNFIDCKIYDTNFIGDTMNSIDFGYSKIEDCKFDYVKASKVELDNADLSNSSFVKADELINCLAEEYIYSTPSEELCKNLIPELLKEKKISIKSLSERIGLTYAATHKIVSKKYIDSISNVNICKIATVLKVAVNELYELELFGVELSEEDENGDVIETGYDHMIGKDFFTLEEAKEFLYNLEISLNHKTRYCSFSIYKNYNSDEPQHIADITVNSSIY